MCSLTSSRENLHASSVLMPLLLFINLNALKKWMTTNYAPFALDM